MQLRTVAPCKTQLSLSYQTIDTQQMTALSTWAVFGFVPQLHNVHKSQFLAQCVELAQIIEEDLGLRLLGQSTTHLLIRVQIAQDPIANPSLRDVSHLLLDRLEHCNRALIGWQVQQHWINRGKPADGARDIDPSDLFTPMSLQIYQHLLLSCPLRQRLGQCCEQYLADLRVGAYRDLLQQHLRLPLIQMDLDTAALGFSILPLLMILRQGTHQPPLWSQPVAQLCLPLWRSGFPAQHLPPALIRGGRWHHLHRLSLLQLLVDLLQIAEQPAPGNCIDQQVVADQQQQGWLRARLLQEHRSQ